MKKDKAQADELAPEYDFATMKGGVRGKYFRRSSGDGAENAGTRKPPAKPATRRAGR